MGEPLHPEVAILNAALELPGGERAAYLHSACAGDEKLRQRIEELLRAYEQSDSFLDTPLPRTELVSDSVPLTEKPGDRIGRYKLIEQIGEGGCGVVYMAEQEEPVRRKVALKVIKLGMDTKQVIARFEAERQALALMDHPNIAKVLDAGATTTGRPYFVMELVRGIRITQFCHENALSIDDRIRLFVEVCRAIQHAHQKGVIHRDIKPSNVLVEAHEGKPLAKVIDFGIAKATQGRLTDHTLFTALQQFVGTPAYMSPEQASMSGVDIDTRSDIYSLGILLYELLTGRPPFDERELLASGIDEMRRIIREKEPVKPSRLVERNGELRVERNARRGEAPTLHSQLQPLSTPPKPLSTDLDWIVMKCLEKDRTRRYETANGLASDLQRHLNHEPVEARPPSGFYRLQKLAQRNKLAFLSGGVLLFALIAVAIASNVAAWRVAGARRAESVERQKAETANLQLQQTIDLLELEKAEDSFESHDAATGVAYLGWVLRRNPRQTVAAQRLVSALNQRRWAILDAPQLRHWERVTSAQFSPDGEQVLTGSLGRNAHVWDAHTGRLVSTLEHEGRLSAVSFSPDGARILTAGGNSARVWELKTGKPLLSCSHEKTVYHAEFSPDGRWIATASGDSTARIWNAVDGTLKHELRKHTSHVVKARFSPDGKRLATSGSHGSVRMWNAETGEMLFRVEDRDSLLMAFSFSPDGKRLLVACEDDIVKLWSVENGQLIGQPLLHKHPLRHAAFSPDSKWVLTTCEDGAVRLWDAETARLDETMFRHERGVVFGEFSPDGKSIVTTCSDKTARVWKISDGTPLCQPLRHMERVVQARFSSDGGRVVTASYDGIAQVWALRDPVESPTRIHHDSHVAPLAFSPDGTTLLTAARDKSACLWDARTGQASADFLTNQAFILAGDIAPGGHRVVMSSGSGATRVWELKDGNSALKSWNLVAGPSRHQKPVHSVCFNKDGTHFLTASHDGTARVWNSSSGEPVTPPLVHAGAVVMARFSHDGGLVATASEDRTARIWNAQTGAPVTDPLQHLDHVKWIDFSPAGESLVTSSTDNTACLWDVQTGRKKTTLKHSQTVEGGIFSSDGLRVATGSLDRTARIWDAATGQALTPPLRHDSLVDHIFFSGDGRRLVTTCRSGAARFWDSRNGRPLTEWLHSDTIWGAAFDPKAGRIAVGSQEGIARLWEIPSAPIPIPEWFPAFAEAVAGIRMTSQGNFELVSPSELDRLVRQLQPESGGGFYEGLARRFVKDSGSL